jgi:pyrrolidone-carboxylate peptidase
MPRLTPQARKAPSPAKEGKLSSSGASASGNAARAPASPLLDLQRAAGNELTGRMIGGMLVQAKLRDEAPEPTEPPPEATPAEPEAETPTAELIVDDSTGTIGPGQMKKSDFFARLRVEVGAALEAALAGSDRSAQAGPLIETWLGDYEGQDVERINRDLPRFAGDGPRPATAEEYVARIAARVRAGVGTWARTGEVTGIPEGLSLPGMGLLGGVFFKAKPGGPRDPGDVRDLQARLGAGRPLDGAIRSRMESAFGRSFSQVRVHTDSGAAGLASRLNAKAFTLGEHVAFGAREYRPGTLVGDALLAHELAHVAQQGDGEAAAAGYQELERDADLAAAGATAALWSGLRGRPAPRLASGLRLQRCTSCNQTREEKVLDQSTLPGQLLAASGFDRFLPAFEAALQRATDLQAATRLVDAHGRALWQAATRRAQATSNANTDDRPLYWARLQMTRALRRWDPSFSLASADREALIQRFERASRGMDTATFQAAAGVKRILISGFDPFALDPNDPSRGNSSGAAVLALDGTTVTNGAVSGEVQGVIFPVRFADFDAGMVESFFGPYLNGANPVHMIMTISQGGSALFEVEQYAGRRRSTEAPDNLRERDRGTRAVPAVPPGLAAGPEFLETALPTATIRQSLGQTSPLPQETEFEETLPQGATPGARPNPGSTAVAGSGGGYLSNEIFYRTLLLRRQNGATIPVGHLHTPYMDPASSFSSPAAFRQERDRIVDTVRTILRDVLPTLGP